MSRRQALEVATAKLAAEPRVDFGWADLTLPQQDVLAAIGEQFVHAEDIGASGMVLKALQRRQLINAELDDDGRRCTYWANRNGLALLEARAA